MQRRGDGTVVIEGSRFELPGRYRHLTRVALRYAAWDLTVVHLVDEVTGAVLCRLYPQDKTRNANGQRRPLDLATADPRAATPATGMPPLLAKLLALQAATGLPPAYLPKDEGDNP